MRRTFIRLTVIVASVAVVVVAAVAQSGSSPFGPQRRAEKAGNGLGGVALKESYVVAGSSKVAGAGPQTVTAFPPAYRGISVAPARDATGFERAVQERVVETLSRKDLVPAERLRHFAWCDTPDLAVIGWSAQVQDMVAIGEGARVSLVVTPRLARLQGGIPSTRDRLLEVYDIVGEDVRFVGAQGVVDAMPGVLMID